MTYLTRAQVLENRKKVVEYLQKPSRRKAVGSLDRGDGKRCCLGHMCAVLGVKRVVEGSVIYYGEDLEHEYAPDEVIEALGLWDNLGGKLDEPYTRLDTTILQPKYDEEEQPITCLAEANDQLHISPQRIGRYLESVIEGGSTTPWMPLSEYPE